MKHIKKNGKLMTFQELSSLYSIPGSFGFRYWHLRHAFRAQFPDTITLKSDSVKHLLTSGVMGKPLSSLYFYLMVAYDFKPTQTLDTWRSDIPTLDDEEWEKCVSTFIPFMIAATPLNFC